MHWQLLRIPKGDGTFVVQKFATPQWGNVTPFALPSGSHFRPAGPNRDAASSEYREQANQILHFSAGLNDRTKTIADYWANGPHSETPSGHWNLFAQIVSRRDKHDLNRDIKMFFILTNAIFDAGIACWDAKRAFDSERPITAVHFLYTGQQIRAWGGIGKGTQTIDGSQWKQYQAAKGAQSPFPEYVSGHSGFSAAGARILQLFTKSDTFGASFTSAPGSSQIEPGFAPSASVTLSWSTFSAAAAQTGISRRIAGIHFRQGDLDGRALGSKVAVLAWRKAQAFIHGDVE